MNIFGAALVWAADAQEGSVSAAAAVALVARKSLRVSAEDM
jgi:hypothetical protein